MVTNEKLYICTIIIRIAFLLGRLFELKNFVPAKKKAPFIFVEFISSPN